LSETGRQQRGRDEPDGAPSGLSAVVDVGRLAGKVLLSSPTAFLAYAGVGLYVIGLVRTVGVLHAENIPITRGLPLAPLQDYLVRGLAVVVTPQTFMYILVIGLMLAFASMDLVPGIVAGRRVAPDDDNDASGTDLPALSAPAVSPRSSGKPEVFFPPAFGLVLIAAVILVPLAQWLPFVPGAAVAAWAFFSLLDMAEQPTVDTARFAIYVAALLGSLSLAWAMHAYFHPSSLDIATITPKKGKAWSASLLYSTNQMLYVLGKEDRESGHRRIEEIPVESLKSVEIIDGPPRNFNTVADLLGIRLWRYTEENGKPHIERSPPHLQPVWDKLKPPWEWSFP